MTIRNRLVGIATALTVAGGTWFGVLAWAQTAPKVAAKPAAPSEPTVAVVGGRRITRAAFEQRVREAEETYRERANASVPTAFRPVMRRQILEAMIREQLLVLEARRRGMALTPDQAEAELKKDAFFQRGGSFDEAKFLAVKNTQPAQFKNALQTIEEQLPALRLKQQLERENSPPQSELKSRIERDLSLVTIDFLALRRGAFAAQSPEPSEREVIDFYRGHASEYPRPEQAVLTLLDVNEPALDPVKRKDPASVQAWEARMKERADSLLSSLKKGATLEALAPRFGDLDHDVVATRDHFPTRWRGGTRAQQAVFSAPIGSLLQESVPSNNGFLLVRIDERQSAHIATLEEVVGTIRNRLREAAASSVQTRQLDELYATVKDSLRGPAYRVRYAVADTGLMAMPEPPAADLDRFYRGHLADYSLFDPKTSTVGAKPLAEVRDDVRRRLLQERRTAAARASSEQLLNLWKSGKRDPKIERAMTFARDVGPVPVGAVVDTGLAGVTLTDTLSSNPGERTEMLRTSRGFLVYQSYGEIRNYVPTRDEARSLLQARLTPRSQNTEEAGARRLYDENPGRFRAANLVRFSRLMVNLPDPLEVPLSRDDVTHYYRAHPEDYGAPELAHVRHILVIPKDTSPQADAAARARCEEAMRRLKSGDSFLDLVKEYSEDEATRDKGGDVGVFRHGMMLEDFEREAFSMQPGDLRGPVKTEVGYHVIECLEHVPAEVTPLRYAYSTVAQDAAHEKSDKIARFRADSLRHALKTIAQANRAAKSMGFVVYHNDQVVGAKAGVATLEDYFRRIDTLKPGQFDNAVQEYRGMGYAITWVDSIVPQRRPSWNEVRDQALDLYRREANRSVLERKKAEFDSLLHAGWTFDSLGTLFGGLERHGPHGPGSGLERLAGRDLLDSLAFGTDQTAPVLQPGKITGWIEFPAGWAMMRLVERRGADPVQLAARMENESRGRLERKLTTVFDKLKERYPVRIEDPELRLTELPTPPG